MNSYKFVFVIGMLNLTVPFFGIPATYKYVIFVAAGILTILQALYIRAVIKEREAGLLSEKKSEDTHASQATRTESRTIEEVIEMEDEPKPVRASRVQRTKAPRIVVSDVKPKPRIKKPKIRVMEEVYE